MKRLSTTLGVLALGAALASPAFAINLFSDGFSYPNGNLAPNGGWAVYSPGTLDLQVNAGRVNGFAVPNNTQDDHRLFAAQSTTSKTYACFIVNIPTFAGTPEPNYFAMLKDGGTSVFVSRLYVVNFPGGGWTLGISHSSTGAAVGLTRWTAPLNHNQNYTVVINYDPVAKTSTLWVNPTNELSPSVTDTNAAIAAISVQGFGLRQSNSASTLPAEFAGTTEWNWTLDALGVGTSFDDACSRPTPTRASTWGSVKAIYR